jgi:hypothetical protein
VHKLFTPIAWKAFAWHADGGWRGLEHDTTPGFTKSDFLVKIKMLVSDPIVGCSPSARPWARVPCWRPPGRWRATSTMTT